MNPAINQGVGVAILNAHKNCCHTCDVLAQVRVMMADELEALPAAAPAEGIVSEFAQAFEAAGFTPANA